MTVRADSLLGRLVTAARPGSPWVRITVSPWFARLLVSAGARRASTPDAMSIGIGNDATRPVHRIYLSLRVRQASKIRGILRQISTIGDMTQTVESMPLADRLAFREPLYDIVRLLDFALNLDSASFVAERIPRELPTKNRRWSWSSGALAMTSFLDRASYIAGELVFDDILDYGSALDIAQIRAHNLLIDLREAGFDSAAVAQDVRKLADSIAHIRDVTVKLIGREAGSADFEIAGVTTQDVETLRTAVNDFTGADLRDVDLTDVLLDGVRWSTTTEWPSRWIEQVERSSAYLGDGVYEIIRGRGELIMEALRVR